MINCRIANEMILEYSSLSNRNNQLERLKLFWKTFKYSLQPHQTYHLSSRIPSRLLVYQNIYLCIQQHLIHYVEFSSFTRLGQRIFANGVQVPVSET